MITPTQTWRPKPRRHGALLSGVDTSPLLAIFLVLFIVFSVGAARPFHDGKQVDFPYAATAKPQPGSVREDSLQVAVTRNGDLFVSGNGTMTFSRVSADELRSRLQYVRQPSAERRVYIRADARARYSDVGKVLDAIRSIGIHDVTFIANLKTTPTQPNTQPPSPAKN